MKSRLLLFTLLLSFSLQAQNKKVLFLGNSYTGVNDLPQLVYDVALSTGDSIIYDKNTPGGTTLASHASNATTQAKIKADNWDYVVLQAQSQEPSFPIQQVETETFPFAQQLCDSIRANDICSRPLFYMTWGRENGDASNCPFWPPVCTYEGMDSLLNLRYRMMADMNDGYVSPVGATWRYIRDNHPEIGLYTGDGSHPSQAGSYAAACTFYTIIVQKDPTFIQYNFSLTDSIANLIKNAAKIIAFDNLSEWNVGKYGPVANFVYSQEEDAVSFENASTSFDSLYWEFGDGNFSTEINPIYNYTENGSYQVNLIASNCGITDTLTENISITSFSTAIETLKDIAVKLYPNPSTDILFIDNIKGIPIEITIYDTTGKILMSQYNPSKIDLRDYENGVYIISIENTQTKQKSIKKIILKKDR